MTLKGFWRLYDTLGLGTLEVFDVIRFGSDCPITAVYRKKTGRHISKFCSIRAAREIDLDGVFANAVVKAADNLIEHDPKIRARLMEAVQ